MPDCIANLRRVLCEEARVGKRVRVREGTHRYPPLSVTVGTIEKRWGNSSYVALDVLLDDGSRQLFWFHELEEIAERA
jgi:hypothetical protein